MREAQLLIVFFAVGAILLVGTSMWQMGGQEPTETAELEQYESVAGFYEILANEWVAVLFFIMIAVAYVAFTRYRGL